MAQYGANPNLQAGTQPLTSFLNGIGLQAQTPRTPVADPRQQQLFTNPAGWFNSPQSQQVAPQSQNSLQGWFGNSPQLQQQQQAQRNFLVGSGELSPKKGQSVSGGPCTSPLDVQRTCTNTGYLLVLVLALAVIAGCLYVGFTQGDIRRLTALPNYEGKLCGENGQGPYLYFCKAGTAALDLHHGICVDSCPAAGETMNCSGSPQKSQQSYATVRFARSLCIATGDDTFRNGEASLFLGNPFLQTAFSVLQLASELEPIGIAVAAASAMSFLWMALISCCAEPLILLGIAFLVLAPGSVGGVLIYASQHEGWLVLNGTAFSTGHDLATGIACCCASVLVIIVSACKAASIRESAATVYEASACVMEMPILLLEPWLSTAFKVALAVPAFFGFALLNFAGDIPESVDFTQNSQLYVAGNLPKVCWLAYLITVCWLFELQHAISQFVTIYAAEVWFFKTNPNQPNQRQQVNFGIADLGQAFCAAVSYHLGSLIYGSLLIPLLRIPRVFCLFLVRVAGDPSNPTPTGCLGCAEQVVDYGSNLSYMDIALNSTNYAEGAESAAMATRKVNPGGAAFTEGAATQFSFLGVCLVATGTGCLNWLLCTRVERYSSPSSEENVHDVVGLTVFTVILGVLIASPFASMFDTVTDTMVYCRGQPEANGFFPANFGFGGFGGADWFGGFGVGQKPQGH